MQHQALDQEVNTWGGGCVVWWLGGGARGDRSRECVVQRYAETLASEHHELYHRLCPDVQLTLQPSCLHHLPLPLLHLTAHPSPPPGAGAGASPTVEATLSSNLSLM
jgi:hypothetical protein